MERIDFSLSGGLSPAQLSVMHEAVVKVLEETGLECQHQPTVEAVTSTPGARFEGGRLKFSRDLIEENIAAARAAGRRRQPEERLRVTAPWNCFNIIDMDSAEIRPSTAADVVEMLKLVASRNDSGPAPVYPCDLDERIQILWLEKACLENTARFGGEILTHDLDTIRWLGEMYQVVGRRYQISMQVTISPLRLDHLALETYWKLKDDDLVTPSLSLCPIPVGGLTAPYFPSGLLVQGIAESLGGLIVSSLLGATPPETWLALRVDFGDMRDMTVGYSLPENVMIQVLLRDAAEHFSGFRHDTIYLNTNAKQPDAFAAVDRMAYLLMLALAGYRHFCLGAGQLSMDEVFSPAQFILDNEMARYVERVLGGLAWDGDADAIANVIAEGAVEGNFLSHDTTLDALPDMFDSLLFRRSNIDRWRSEGGRPIVQEALDRARAAIAEYEFHLDDSVQSDLDRTFEKACKSLGVDPASQPLPK